MNELQKLGLDSNNYSITPSLQTSTDLSTVGDLSALDQLPPTYTSGLDISESSVTNKTDSSSIIILIIGCLVIIGMIILAIVVAVNRKKKDDERNASIIERVDTESVTTSENEHGEKVVTTQLCTNGGCTTKTCSGGKCLTSFRHVYRFR